MSESPKYRLLPCCARAAEFAQIDDNDGPIVWLWTGEDSIWNVTFCPFCGQLFRVVASDRE